jgi:hypothetical protein
MGTVVDIYLVLEESIEYKSSVLVLISGLARYTQ